MASVFSSDAAPAAPLPPIGRYRRDALSPRGLRRAYIALGVAAALYGFIFALFGQNNFMGFMAPLGLLAAVAIWTMPQLRYPPVRLMCALFPPFVYALLFWPDYLAFTAGNLPWITAIRLIGVPMTLLLLFCTFGSPAFRARMGDILDGERIILRLAVAFLVIGGLVIVLSKDPGYSLTKFLLVCWSWFGVFIVACYYFSKRGTPRRFAHMLVILTIFNIAVAFYEMKYRQLPWAGRIPWFLEIDDPRIRALLAGIARAGGGVYRVQAKFSTSIGLGEYFGMALPFLLHLMFTARTLLPKVVMAVIVALSLMVVLETDSRLAFISFCSSLMFYVLFQAFITWRWRKRSLFAPAVMMLYPFGMLLFAILALTWRRLEVMVFGGGMQQYSTIARKLQWAMGWPKIFKNPLGYGLGQSGDTLGFRSPGGQLTVDSYYLSALLEIGVIGFLVYFGMFVVGIIQSGRAAIETRDEDTLFLGACAVALLNYMVSKSIYSQLENNPMAFIILGLVVALLRRYKAEKGQLPPLPEDDGLAKPVKVRGVPPSLARPTPAPT